MLLAYIAVSSLYIRGRSEEKGNEVVRKGVFGKLRERSSFLTESQLLALGDIWCGWQENASGFWFCSRERRCVFWELVQAFVPCVYQGRCVTM